MLVALGVVVGCFSEPMETDTCRDGEVGCPCGVGCDAGLVCADGIELCIPENCVPGSELCTCNGGECLEGLDCDGGLCRPPNDSGSNSNDGTASADDVASTPGSLTDASTTGVETSDPTTFTTSDPSTTMTSTTEDPTDPSFTTDPSVTDPSTTETDLTTDTVSDSAMTASDTGMPIDGEACRACIIEANSPAGLCEMTLAGCAPNSACTDLAGCVGGCLDMDDPSCIEGCCAANPNGVPDYAALADCHTEQCPMACVGFELHCGG